MYGQKQNLRKEARKNNHTIIKVKKEDEPKIIVILASFYEHLKKLWNPISQEINL